MAMALVPLAIAAVDYAQKQQQNNNVDQANQAFQQAIRTSQGQTAQYRGDLRNQMLTAMNNRLAAYNPAQGLLASAMGGAPMLNTGRPQGALPRPGAGLASSFSGAGQPVNAGFSPSGVGNFTPPGPMTGLLGAAQPMTRPPLPGSVPGGLLGGSSR